MIPCDYHPDEYKTRHENVVHVTAPDDVLHEAFFDPVTDGSAIAADSTNGILKPVSFTDANNASASLQRIAWASENTVEGEGQSAHWASPGQVMDFIELDGFGVTLVERRRSDH